MTRRLLNFCILALGLSYLGLNSALNAAVSYYSIAYAPWILAIAFVGGLPIFLAFYLIVRCSNSLKNDEYQRQLLTRQMLFTSISTLAFISIKGFWDAHVGGHNSYAGYILNWSILWFVAGFQKQYNQ